MSNNHEALVKYLGMQIEKLFQKVASIPSSNEGFIFNIIDNPKNDTCKAIELGHGVKPSQKEDEICEVWDLEEEVEVKKRGE